MAWQKFRADVSETQSDGSVAWYTNWFGGLTLSKIVDCCLDSLAGEMRRTVFITGEADTYFSIPAVCKIAGIWIRGYVTVEHDDSGNANLVFCHCYV